MSAFERTRNTVTGFALLLAPSFSIFFSYLFVLSRVFFFFFLISCTIFLPFPFQDFLFRKVCFHNEVHYYQTKKITIFIYLKTDYY